MWLAERPTEHLDLTKLFDGVGEGSAASPQAQLGQLRERLRQVARAAERSEQARSQQSRVFQAELKRAHDKEREKGAEAERLRWELEQLGEREASRSKVSMLQEEVRNFKSASQHKLLQMELTQLREREVALNKKVREADDELKALRGGGEKRLSDVEAQRAREVDIHERRIVKLMSVIEALTAAGDERTDMRLLAEKMNQLREVRELLDEEKAMVRAFQKRHREVLSSDSAAEREGYRRRISELEAEVKLSRSMGQAQVDEVSQSHAAELSALQRRMSELEEEKAGLKRSFEQRLADEKGQRYADVQERERRRLSLEEGFKAQVGEARREVAEAQAGAQAANTRAATLMQQNQQQQRELLLLKQQSQQAAPQAKAELEGLRAHNRQLEDRLASATMEVHAALHSSVSGSAEATVKAERLQAEVMQLTTKLGEAKANLEEAQANLDHAQADVEAERLEKLHAETRAAEADELLELEREEHALRRAEEAEARHERMRAVREGYSEKVLGMARERLLRILLGAWSRYARGKRLLASRERAAQLIAAADDVRQSAELQAEQLRREMMSHQAVTGESIGAMRLEALSRASAIDQTKAEIEALRSQLHSEASATQAARAAALAVRERSRLLERRMANRLAALYGRGTAQLAFMAWREVTNKGLEEREVVALEAKLTHQQEGMSRRILSQLIGSFLSHVVGAWRQWARGEAARRSKLSELSASRGQAEAEQQRLRDELTASAASEEERNALKKEAMSRRLLKGCGQRLTAVVLGAWRAWVHERARQREIDRLEAELGAAEERSEVLRVEEALVADVQKERIAGKVGRMLLVADVRRIFHGWSDLVKVARAKREQRASLSVQAEHQSALDEHMDVVLGRVSEARFKLVSKALSAQLTGLLTHVFDAWRSLVTREALRRLEEERRDELHNNVSRLSMLDSELNMVRSSSLIERQALDERIGQLAGEAARAQHEAERSTAVAVAKQAVAQQALVEEERKAAAKMSKVLERMQRDRLWQLVARMLLGWRGVALLARAEGSQAEVASQHKLAQASREVEARRADMVRCEARLEGQARIAELEAALRKAELDGADRLRQSELRAEERRMADTRTHQLQLNDAQSALRMDRINLEARAAELRREIQAGHEAELAELAVLRKERRELEAVRADYERAIAHSEANKAANGGWMAEQSSQLKEITALQLQLAELQRELQMRDDNQQQQGGGSSSSNAAGGFLGGLFGGGGWGSNAAGSPPRSATWPSQAAAREEELAAQLEEKSAEAAALSVQLANLKVALGNQEEMIVRLRHQS